MTRGCSVEQLTRILLKAGVPLSRIENDKGRVTFYVLRNGEEHALHADTDEWNQFIEDEKAKQRRQPRQ